MSKLDSWQLAAILWLATKCEQRAAAIRRKYRPAMTLPLDDPPQRKRTIEQIVRECGK